jgi:hypothetical protein
MWAGLSVDAFVGQTKPLHRAAAYEVLVDDLGGVFRPDVAVPDGLRVDDNSGAMLALIQAAGLVNADARAEVGGLDKLLDGCMEFGLTVGVAGGARCILGAGIGADKYVSFKRGQAVLLRKLCMNPE